MKPFISPANLTKEAEDLLNKVFRIQHLTTTNFKIQHQCQVDGETWYTVSCSYDASQWIRRQSRTLWYEHINGKWDVIHNTFDIHEKLYTLLALRWS